MTIAVTFLIVISNTELFFSISFFAYLIPRRNRKPLTYHAECQGPMDLVMAVRLISAILGLYLVVGVF